MFVLASADFTHGLGLGIDIGNGAEVSFNDLLPHLGDDDRLVEIVLDRMDAQSGPDRQSSKA